MAPVRKIPFFVLGKGRIIGYCHSSFWLRPVSVVALLGQNAEGDIGHSEMRTGNRGFLCDSNILIIEDSDSGDELACGLGFDLMG